MKTKILKPFVLQTVQINLVTPNTCSQLRSLLHFVKDQRDIPASKRSIRRRHKRKMVAKTK